MDEFKLSPTISSNGNSQQSTPNSNSSPMTKFILQDVDSESDDQDLNLNGENSIPTI